MIKYLKDTTVGRGPYRQWIYQTCTEFGFCTGHAPNTHVLLQTLLLLQLFFPFSFTDQSCEEATCPFSQMITLSSQTEVCQSVFGISERSLPGSVAFSNMYYGGEHPNLHRVLYVNGESKPAA